jgi:hypothetical protein
MINLIMSIVTLLSCDKSKVTMPSFAMSYWAIRVLRRVATDLRSFEDGRIPQDAVWFYSQPPNCLSRTLGTTTVGRALFRIGL